MRTNPVGTSAVTIVAQSLLCHPDWTPEDHAMYLNAEEEWRLHRTFTVADIEAMLPAARRLVLAHELTELHELGAISVEGFDEFGRWLVRLADGTDRTWTSEEASAFVAGVAAVRP